MMCKSISNQGLHIGLQTLAVLIIMDAFYKKPQYPGSDPGQHPYQYQYYG
ncbi:hypothetical protein [Thermosulfurimonas sp. F29]|nr:hypothetical protein [Thermosulfurimonas sp. F29]